MLFHLCAEWWNVRSREMNSLISSVTRVVLGSIIVVLCICAGRTAATEGSNNASAIGVLQPLQRGNSGEAANSTSTSAPAPHGRGYNKFQEVRQGWPSAGLPPEVRPMTDRSNSTGPVPCTCGVFLSSQCRGGAPSGLPAISHEFSRPTPNTGFGNRQCTSACVDMIVRHLHNSAAILCSIIQKDVWREKAYLFIKNHRDKWIPTRLAAGRDFCCKDGVPVKCPPF